MYDLTFLTNKIFFIGQSIENKPSIFEQTTDLRKEMEMTEHHETIAEVFERHDTGHEGLSTTEAKRVSNL